ncbi:hypothetical protein AB0B60_46060 [Streptomyces lincolnensis]|uniref:hypothetical protein n=1 Tax=Streptomyces lincolnensis TaxID=1915 RepID=UPI000833C4FE|nr:hypothetical protein [Streptomyces lincolnensis]
MRPQQPRTIDEALARARIREDAYTPDHREASRRRISDQLHELRWIQALTGPAGIVGSGGRTPRRVPLLLHERAAHDLRALCQGIIHDDDAARRIARFDTARDPGGALAFACLLLLADREEGAQFWLQFAAGGGQATGAICLYLMHLRRGEWRDATYWARQIEALEGEPCQYAPVAHEVVDTTTGLPGAGGALTVFLDLPDNTDTVPEAAVKDTVDDLAVARIDGLGPIPQPHAGLAHQLEDLITIGH